MELLQEISNLGIYCNLEYRNLVEIKYSDVCNIPLWFQNKAKRYL